MLQIKVRHVDELHIIAIELGVLSYLRELIHADQADHILCQNEWISIRKNAEGYLDECQVEIVKRLETLLERDDFACHVDLTP